MRSSDSEKALFTVGYREKLKQQYPCYGGIAWAMRIIETYPTEDELQKLTRTERTLKWSLREEAFQVFEELYTLSLAELAKEGLDQLRGSMAATGDRGSWHGRHDEEPKAPREKALWCKREIQNIEEFRKKVQRQKEPL